MWSCCAMQFAEKPINISLDVENCTNSKGKSSILQVNVDKQVIDVAVM